VRSFADLAMGLVAPPRCAVCSGLADPERALCGRCDAELATAPVQPAVVPGVDRALAAAPYTGVARSLVGGLKFRRLLRLADRAAEAIVAGCGSVLEGPLVPVPAAPLRRRVRGFDPAEEIAWALARRRGLRPAPCLRRRQGPRQVGRPRAERLADPPRVTLCAPAPAEVVLVDDVITTGATLAACAHALRDGGTEHIVAVAFARSPR
jgi:predicted amidophosphoribosyltransferase